MVSVKTKTGFECDIDEDRLDDWEVLDQISGMEDGDLLQAPRLLKKLLSKEDVRKLMDLHREESGRVPTEAIMDELLDIFGQVKEAKNS